MTPVRICYVCTGNICRSPMAVSVTKEMAFKKKLEIITQSRGVAGWHAGDEMDKRAQQALLKRGYKYIDHRAKKITAEDFKAFELLIAMDSGHFMELSVLKSRLLGIKKPNDGLPRIIKFTHFLNPPLKDTDVPDPYYGTQKDFDKVLDLIEQGVEKILFNIENNDNLNLASN